MPRITIIMGIYNCAATLSEALDSLYEQTYTDFKIILCDDASSDDTYNIAKKYATQKNNITLIKNDKNLKLAATLNRCLQYADTEYVARMDGDDISLPNRLEQEIFFLDHHPDFAIVSCPMIYFDESGDYMKGKCEKEPTRKSFRYGTPFCHAPSMMRTAALKDVGGYTIGKQTERIEDYHLWSKFYLKGYKGYNLQECLYKMRNDKNAFSRRKASDRWHAFWTQIKIMQSLGLSHSYFYSLPSLIRIIIPNSLIKFIRIYFLSKKI